MHNCRKGRDCLFLHTYTDTKETLLCSHACDVLLTSGGETFTYCILLHCILILWLSYSALQFQLKNKFMKKLPRDAEASNVLVGEVDFLETPFVAFVRLQQAVMLGALTEVPVPTR